MRVIKGTIIEAVEFGKLKVTPRGSLLINDSGVIEGVFSSLPASADAETEDWGDALILQSFCDMHLHAPQYPLTGTAMDKSLIDWLSSYAFPAERRLCDREYARRIYRRLASDLIANGTTRLSAFSSLHTESTLILMEEFEKAGICGCVGKVNMDRNGGEGLEETTEESKRETLRWLDASHSFTHIRPIITPRFTPSCTDALMAWLGEIAEERNLPVQSHLSENTREIEWVKSLHPECSEYWETYDRYGLFKENTIMAHCVHSSEREIEAMASHSVTAAYCADSNINIMSGVAPIRHMIDKGVRVTLGSDVAGGSEKAMYRVMTTSIKASKVRSMYDSDAPKPLSAAEAYWLGTTSGHIYFGDRAGFAKGNKLHALIVDDSTMIESPHPLTPEERLERAIYNMDDRNIRAVWSDGRRVR